LKTVEPGDDSAMLPFALRSPLNVVEPLLIVTFPVDDVAAPKVVVPELVTAIEEVPLTPLLKFTVPWPPTDTAPLVVSDWKFTTPEEFVVRLPLPPTWPVKVVLPAPATVSPKLDVATGLPSVSVPLALDIVAALVRLIWPLRVLLPETFWIAPAPDTPDPPIASPLSLTVMLFLKANVAPGATVANVLEPRAVLLVASTVPAFTVSEFEKELFPESVSVPDPLL